MAFVSPIRLQNTLGPVLIATKGQAAPEVEHTYARARALVQQVGDTPQRFQVLWGLRRFYLVRAEFLTARELAEQLLHLAQHANNPVFLVPAHFALGAVLFWLGEFLPARVCLEEGLTFYDPQHHHELAFRYGDDPGVSCLSYVAMTLWSLGYADQARQRIQEAMLFARESAHPYSLAWALYHAVQLHHYFREPCGVQEHAETAMAICQEQGFTFFGALATLHRGWALTQQGQTEEGLQQIHQGLRVHQATGAKAGVPYHQTLLAEAYGQGGQATEGLQVIDASLSVIEKTRERFFKAELHRLKGELLLQQSSDNHVEAEASFQKALSIARSQQAKSWELRAATSLAKLWQSQDKRQDTYDLLAPVYGWFTEGFDTADLKDAKALLDELEESR